ncbi:L,D-transpeptidase [Actibacterium sp. 188UL27-1]|uniref:L,D-transpeptidase n=1 Tax=Actibacterium sp. 188UL27-1 TaxID=2786961 RepID=UPI00195CFCC0|nr:L,D-transpeptidase [Actibacterium sp. 188UL27-1]MBM7068957.1 L,D-transpeptidase [Actibacterium sp. 188UL27-1]
MTTRRHLLTSGLAALATPALISVSHAANGPKGWTLADEHKPRLVKVKKELAAGQIHVVTGSHYLYFTLGDGKAVRYGVAVGSEGRNFKGSATIRRKVEWPSWTPTANMIAREPAKYARFAGGMAGGPGNPLGARALYLYRGGRDTYYRIHGTPQPWTIGRSVSSGCIRMVNEHVTQLYQRIPIGTKVTVY